MSESNEILKMSVNESELEEFPEVPIDDDDEENLEVYYTKTHRNARTPRKGSRRSAGYDLFTCEGGVIPAGHVRLINLGIQIEIQSKNICAKIYSRSGLKYRKKVEVVSSPSIIDRDFTDTIYIPMCNKSDKDFHYSRGVRIAQLLFETYHNANWVYVKKRSDFPKNGKSVKLRGSFGSTGE